MSTHFDIVSYYFRSDGTECTYREQSSAVHGQLDYLDRRVVARLDRHVGRQRYLRQTQGAGVGVLARSENLEGRHDRETHVAGTAVGAVSSQTHVDIEESGGVALEPARLEGDGTADGRPVRPVLCKGHPAACKSVSVHFFLLVPRSHTWIHPLHAVGERRVRDQVVSSPAWICDDGVRRGHGGARYAQ